MASLTTNLNILHCTHPSALFERYSGQTSPQPAFIWLDLRSGNLYAECDGNIGGGHSGEVDLGYVQRWAVPALKTPVVNALLDQIRPLAQRILDGACIEWDGSNNAVELDDDASAAAEEISSVCDRAGGEGRELVVYDGGDFIAYSSPTALGLTPDTTDAQIAEIAKRETDKARGEGVDEIDGLEDALTEMRDRLREDAEEADDDGEEQTR